MNPALIFGIARHVLTIAAGALASRGVIGENETETLVGAVLALAGIGWSIYDKRRKG
jgi:hypothetical protein